MRDDSYTQGTHTVDDSEHPGLSAVGLRSAPLPSQPADPGDAIGLARTWCADVDAGGVGLVRTRGCRRRVSDFRLRAYGVNTP